MCARASARTRAHTYRFPGCDSPPSRVRQSYHGSSSPRHRYRLVCGHGEKMEAGVRGAFTRGNNCSLRGGLRRWSMYACVCNASHADKYYQDNLWRLGPQESAGVCAHTHTLVRGISLFTHPQPYTLSKIPLQYRTKMSSHSHHCMSQRRRVRLGIAT